MKNIDSNIACLLNKYSDSKKDGLFLCEYLERAALSEPIIPVLGMQGMGKSTLINAILEENILPNEVDETTCVPVEIKYAEKEYAMVYFSDSDRMERVHTIDELSQYVDNKYNPANEKGVLKIILFRDREILKSGIVIVDLPGVGSITAANEVTTNKYIQNLCTAIFVIPTVPTIRRFEAMFIKGVWSQFSRAIFVQNHWGETQQELSESVDYNSKLLRGVAESINNNFSDDILVINAYDAIAGALQHNSTMRKSSNIDALTESIRTLAANWQSLHNEDMKEKSILTIKSAIKYANRLLLEQNQSIEETIRQRETELSNMQVSTNKMEEEFYKIKSYLGQQEFTVRKKAKEDASACVKRLRVSMNKIIDGGVFDGDTLTIAFKDNQQEYVAECLDSLFDVVSNIKIEVDIKLQDLCDVVLENDMKYDPEQVEFSSKLKWEKGMDAMFKIGGGIGGVVAGAKVGAAVGTAMGPAGAAVGAITGLAVGIVCSFVGSFTKKKVRENRAIDTKRQLDPFYEDIEKAIVNTFVEKFGSYSSAVKIVLGSIVQERRNTEQIKRSEINNVANESQVSEIKSDIEQLSEYQKSI